MSAPDYPDDVTDTRLALMERFKPGTRVTHAYTGAWTGAVTKLHVGTLKRPKHHSRFTASVQWDGRSTAMINALALLRPVK